MKMKKKEKKPIKVNVTFTEGYEKRFTEAILKIYESRQRKATKESSDSGKGA